MRVRPDLSIPRHVTSSLNPIALQPYSSIVKAMAKAAKDKTELPAVPQNGSARGSWHTATAGMYTAEGLAALRSSQAFTPKPSGAGSRGRRVRGGGNGDGDEEAKNERVFAGDEAEMVHEAGQQGDLTGEVRTKKGGGWKKLRRREAGDMLSAKTLRNACSARSCRHSPRKAWQIRTYVMLL